MAEQRASTGEEERLPLAFLLGASADQGEGCDDEAGWTGAGAPCRELDQCLLVVEKVVIARVEIDPFVDPGGTPQ